MNVFGQLFQCLILLKQSLVLEGQQKANNFRVLTEPCSLLRRFRQTIIKKGIYGPPPVDEDVVVDDRVGACYYGYDVVRVVVVLVMLVD